MEKERTYLHHINYFRGIAIIFIVYWHCLVCGISNYYQNQTLFAKIIGTLLPGGTTFFVFISGYLFHHIYYHNFQFSTFFIKKLKYVFVPFLIISSTDIFYYLSRYIIAIISASEKSEIFLAKLKTYSFINTYLYGHGEIPIGLWYIPFIMVLFSMSFIFIKFVKIKPSIQLLFICILLIVSILIHRTAANSILGMIQNVIYFTPVYLIGIYFSINFKVLYEKLKGKEFYILFFALCVVIIQTVIGKLEISATECIFKLEDFDLMIIQKTLLSIFFATFLMSYKIKKNKFLTLLAENSFGIFFIHGICIWILNAIVFKISFEYNSTFQYFGFSTLILIISLTITLLIRKVFPNKSKYIIGC